MRRQGRETDDAEIAGRLNGFVSDATKKGIARLLTTTSGARVHGIFKKDREYGCVVERTPPYVPEVHPIELVWNSVKTAYNTRRDDEASAADFVQEFFDNFPDERLLASLRRPEATARRLAPPDEAMLLYNDMGAPCPEEEGVDGVQKEGTHFPDVGEMRTA